jgi:filamentous hemagglutinin
LTGKYFTPDASIAFDIAMLTVGSGTAFGVKAAAGETVLGSGGGSVGRAAEGGAAAAKEPVQALDVGSYQELKAREVVGDGLQHDHIPSFAASRAAKEIELGRSLNSEELSALYKEGTAVELPTDLHQSGRTYGGKNTAAQIEADAANLCAAACADMDKLRSNLNQRGYDPILIEETIKKIADRNAMKGIQ